MESKMRRVAIVVTGPSGVGKSTLIRKWLQLDRDMEFVISHTTRPPRPGEKHGREYYFVAEDEFKKLIHAQAFLEWAIVHGHYYGTSWKEIKRIIKKGYIPLLDIDVQGAWKVQQVMPEALFIFIRPPKLKDLEVRLKKRGDLKPEEMEKRLEQAKNEIACQWMFDVIIENDSIEKSVEELMKAKRTLLRGI